jgi:RluA family pseudouridine synthase
MNNYASDDTMNENLTPPFIDNDLLIVNKFPGVLSVPDGYDATLPHLRSILEPAYGPLWMVHRLDKDTSGLVILARNESAHRSMNQLFRDRQIEKRYHALVTPAPSWQELDIRLPLKVDADRKHRTRVNHTSGKEAQSICYVLKKFTLGALIEIQIMTGITHQIRAHLREHDMQIFGESLYDAGLPPQPLHAPRMMLHARSLTFIHPITGEKLFITASYPEDFRTAYTALQTTRSLDAMI